MAETAFGVQGHTVGRLVVAGAAVIALKRKSPPVGGLAALEGRWF